MARNRALMKNIMGDSVQQLFVGVQSESSRTAAAAVKRRTELQEKQQQPRKATAPAPGSPRKTRRCTRDENARLEGNEGANGEDEEEDDEGREEGGAFEEEEDCDGDEENGEERSAPKRPHPKPLWRKSNAQQGSTSAGGRAVPWCPGSLPPVQRSEGDVGEWRRQLDVVSGLAPVQTDGVPANPPLMGAHRMSPSRDPAGDGRDKGDSGAQSGTLSNGGSGETNKDNNNREGSDAGGGGKDASTDICWVEEGERWNLELQGAIHAFRRLLIWGGEDWEGCVDAYLVFEHAWGFPGKGLLLTPGEGVGRPMAVRVFMQNARRWGVSTELGFSVVGPQEDTESFAHTWWQWWKLLQPKTRVVDPELGLSRPVLMVLGCLLWWGDAVEESEDVLLERDWRVAVQDVLWALKESILGVGDLQKRIALEAMKDKEKAVKKKRTEEEAAVRKERAEKKKTAKAKASVAAPKKCKANALAQEEKPRKCAKR
ncbi:hypothetical protein B0H14DRAFT_3438512 [Mycena olivaceomarginata]|nr:hypothetical protein B0H14DRAFT_3438512 [Mycena olivaceomarginata]